MQDDFVAQLQAFGYQPDHGSGPHLALVAAMVELARRDLSDPLYSASARWFLQESDLVDLFAECVGVDTREFLNA